MIRGYKINFVANTLTITNEFEAAANNPSSDEYKFLIQLKTDHPSMRTIRKTRRSPKKSNPSKGLTYANMKSYMSMFDNADELLNSFEMIKELSKVQPNQYIYVKNWFLERFPKYNELPDFTAINPIKPNKVIALLENKIA